MKDVKTFFDFFLKILIAHVEMKNQSDRNQHDFGTTFWYNEIFDILKIIDVF